VRNHQAKNNLMATKPGDRAFFYHSSEGLEIVGVMEIVGEYRPDPTDPTGKWGMVEVRPLHPVKRPVPLAAIRAEKRLKDLALVRHTRLSVMPVAAEEWRILSEMAGVRP
jgi:predicted RNA-binding protein with PUA-like domain